MLADEVHGPLTYGDAVHVPFAELPGEIEVAVSLPGIAANQVAFSQGESWLDDTRVHISAAAEGKGRGQPGPSLVRAGTASCG